jgi:hypothetical protein
LFFSAKKTNFGFVLLPPNMATVTVKIEVGEPAGSLNNNGGQSQVCFSRFLKPTMVNFTCFLLVFVFYLFLASFYILLVFGYFL